MIGTEGADIAETVFDPRSQDVFFLWTGPPKERESNILRSLQHITLIERLHYRRAGAVVVVSCADVDLHAATWSGSIKPALG